MHRSGIISAPFVIAPRHFQSRKSGISPSSLSLFLLRLSTVDCQLSFLYASSMFGKPRQLESETELYEAAVRALMRRAYSVYEMKQLLGRRTDDDTLLKKVLERLKRAK